MTTTNNKNTTLQDHVCDVTDFAKQRAVFVECNSSIAKAIRTHNTIRAALLTAPGGSEARKNLLHNERMAMRAITLCVRRSDAGTLRVLAYLKSIRPAAVGIIERTHIDGAIASCVADLTRSRPIITVNGLNEKPNGLVIGRALQTAKAA